MGQLNLRGSEIRQICQTLESSFAVPALDALVQVTSPPMHGGVAWGNAKSQVVFELVRTAEQHGTLDLILAAAAADRPYRSDLRSLTFYFSRRPGWSAPVAANELDLRGTLEELTVSADPFFDTSRLAHWVVRVERQVCLVRSGAKKGTGFLVGPDLVLTCYHVVDNHLRGEALAAAVQVKFDYRRTLTGFAPPYEGGNWITIDPQWPIPRAPYSQADITLAGEPADDELDFALLKLAQPVGQMNPPGDPVPRGWIDLSRDPNVPPAQEPILIVQHPEDANQPQQQMPLQIAFATPGFVGLNGNGMRLVYLPSTRRGSSGSPVFDRSLQAVALHHNRGQINPNAVGLVSNNRGVPLGKIRAALSAEVRSLLVPPAAVA